MHFLLSLRIAPLGRAVFPPVIIEVLDVRALRMQKISLYSMGIDPSVLFAYVSKQDKRFSIATSLQGSTCLSDLQYLLSPGEYFV